MESAAQEPGLRQVFLEHVPEARRAELSEQPGLAERLAQIVAAGRESAQDWNVAGADFVRYLAERIPAYRPPEAALGEVRSADLYLACGCALGHTPAAALFRERYGPKLRAAICDRGPEALVEELCQDLLVELLVGTDRHGPLIAKYAGRGALGAWLKVVAVRGANRRLRRARREEPQEMDLLVDRALGEGDPEVGLLKRRYRAEFKRAFEQAFGALSLRHQEVLRQLVVEGLNIDEVGVLFGVHRATVARWRAAARDVLFAETCRRMQEQLGATDEELGSILRLIESRLDASLSRLLAPPAQAPDRE